MSRPAEYMANLSRLFASAERARFVRLKPGSAVLVRIVEPADAIRFPGRE